MTTFRTRLLFALLSLILVVLVALGLLLGQLFKSYYLNTFDARLQKETEMAASYIEGNGGIGSITIERINELGDILDVRVTATDSKGRILMDSSIKSETTQSRHQEIIFEVLKKKSAYESGWEVAGGFNLHYYWQPVMINGEKEGYIFLSTKLAEFQKAYQQIWWILAISLGLSLFMIILLGSRIMARYTKPIESATQVAIELTKGNYRARTYEDQEDETGMLSKSINVLARNLQEMVKSQEMQQDRLGALIENMGSGLILIDSRGYINLVNRPYKEVFNVNPSEYLYKLYYEVIEHKGITEVVEEIFMTEQKVKKQLIIPVNIERRYFEVYGVPIIGTNDEWKGILLVFHDITELKKLEQMRKDFVANVSHELKTPITSIKGFSETLLDGAMENKQTLNDFLNIILTESDRLQSLIQELLDLSKIEKQGFSLSIQQVDLAEVLEDVVAIMKGKAAEKEIVLEYKREDKPVYIEGDVHRLKQVFINIISNAISYTPNQGVVHISLANTGSTVLTEIRDTGIGIEAREIPRIFERFYRVDKARSRNSGGTGLGLAIVKHLVEAHKGTISVKSEVGKGTSFIIELPKIIIEKNG
ncbi:two-component system histidine kinase PnpS [Cytobacillus firmus]|uniref:histidine kinase n=2 Tax=Bacillaceae TaxID=186817 RepID=A0A800MXR5_CYTFI|nr:ATP-binding protein [Cytobacillus firmus]KAF0824418.1 Phosphate regulon sensor protein PhoR (SphS) [Cytobacillus firmus]MBG9547515.1 alkaline phosphatase [Cytobacillus firmus]MBG9603418.1 alkaline phosphatase [Cytobacillus firmus]MDD9310660.1 ATP-binding protein [Cytobacillus firmus]MED1940380.1 ATP-binding protein [Cytobacillus firmus]